MNGEVCWESASVRVEGAFTPLERDGLDGVAVVVVKGLRLLASEAGSTSPMDCLSDCFCTHSAISGLLLEA